MGAAALHDPAIQREVVVVGRLCGVPAFGVLHALGERHFKNTNTASLYGPWRFAEQRQEKSNELTQSTSSVYRRCSTRVRLVVNW